MRKKLPNINRTMSIDAQNNNPGAGRYEDPEKMSSIGRYSVAKHRGSGATTFNPKSSDRFFQFSTFSVIQENVNPGPGNYNNINQLNDKGSYTITRFQGHGKRILDKESR